MALQDIIDPNITYCLPGTSVLEVADAMREDDVSAVVVLNDGEPRGIITERDLILRCLCERLDPARATAADVMTKGVHCVRWDRDIYDVAEVMREGHVRRVVVVDESANVIGVVTFDEVFDLLSEELSNLREAMHPRRPLRESRAA